MRAIPMDQPHLLERSRPGDHIIEIIRPISRLPQPWDEQAKFHMRTCTPSLKSPDRRTIAAGERSILIEHIGGGILGRGNINVDIAPLVVTHPARLFYVRHWKVLEVKE